MSAASLKNPNDAKLSGEVQTLFRGETLRGLLLYAWGWSVVGLIAYWSGIAALLGAIAVLFGLVLGFVTHERQSKRSTHTGTTPEATRMNVAEPVGAGV